MTPPCLSVSLCPNTAQISPENKLDIHHSHFLNLKMQKIHNMRSIHKKQISS